MHLLKDRSFYPLFWTQFLGAFNDNLLKNAFVIAVTIYSVHVFGLPPAQTVVFAGGIFILPFFIFSAVAGQLSDKYDKSVVLRLTKILEIVIMIFSAFALWMEDYEFLLITLFFMGAQSTFFGPAKFSILPQHVPNDKLIAANALIEMGTFLAILLGTILGGVLISLPKGSIIVAVVLLVVAVIGYLSSRKIPSAQPGNAKLKIHWNPVTTTWRQLRFARQNTAVSGAILGGSWFWFVGSFVLSILPGLCLNHFHGNETLITYFLTLFSVGIGIGSVFCDYLIRRFDIVKIIFCGIIGVGASLFGLCFLFLQPVGEDNGTLLSFLQQGIGVTTTLLLILLAFMSGLYIVPLNALVQRKSSVEVRSQVIAAYNINNSLFMVLASILLMGLFYMQLSFFEIFLCLFIMHTFFALYFFRRRHQLIAE